MKACVVLDIFKTIIWSGKSVVRLLKNQVLYYYSTSVYFGIARSSCSSVFKDCSCIYWSALCGRIALCSFSLCDTDVIFLFFWVFFLVCSSVFEDSSCILPLDFSVPLLSRCYRRSLMDIRYRTTLKSLFYVSSDGKLLFRS